MPRDRRQFLATCAAFGFSGTLLPGILWTKLAAAPTVTVTSELLDQVAAMSGLEIPPSERTRLANSLNGQVQGLETIHQVVLPNSATPATIFNPVLLGMKFDLERRPTHRAPVVAATPKDIEEVAFYNVQQLGYLLRNRKIGATDLTQMYLARLRRYDPALLFVITYTEDRALAQAKEADRDIAAGRYRGPLHGIPWGAKDLLAVKGYPTTWGAQPYETQTFGEDATVVKRLDAAGAILVAKLTLGALAQNDVWFGGRTRNPWLQSQGSSGSSAGPASATAAGCVGFAIGSETLGSISSPSSVCGVTGLRPTFGRVPRSGAMTLSWTQDKLGPLCRCVEDAIVVLQAISGPEEDNPNGDRSVHNIPLNWNATASLKTIRVGYLKSGFDAESNPTAGRGGGGFGGGGARGGAAGQAAPTITGAAAARMANTLNAPIELMVQGDARTAYTALADIANLRIDFDPSFQGDAPVHLSLRNVSVQEALGNLAGASHSTWVMTGADSLQVAGATGMAATSGAGRGPAGGAGRGGAGGAGGRGTPEQQAAARAETAKFDSDVLDVLRSLGCDLIPVTLPTVPGIGGNPPSVDVEAASAFDPLTRSGRDALMENVPNSSTWPNTFRLAHFYPAVDFVNYDRIRYQLMQAMDEAFKDIDVLVTPTNGGNQLTITNLTGHPALIVPNGFRSANGTPTSITFLGRLFGEEKVCQVARAWQEKTGFHLKHPDLEAALKSAAAEKAAAGA